MGNYQQTMGGNFTEYIFSQLEMVLTLNSVSQLLLMNEFPNLFDPAVMLTRPLLNIVMGIAGTLYSEGMAMTGNQDISEVSYQIGGQLSD